MRARGTDGEGGGAGHASGPAQVRDGLGGGQAVVDSIKAPLDKAHQVENKLEKAAGKTADMVKDATP